jgi:hypothetical protein
MKRTSAVGGRNIRRKLASPDAAQTTKDLTKNGAKAIPVSKMVAS